MAKFFKSRKIILILLKEILVTVKSSRNIQTLVGTPVFMKMFGGLEVRLITVTISDWAENMQVILYDGLHQKP